MKTRKTKVLFELSFENFGSLAKFIRKFSQNYLLPVERNFSGKIILASKTEFGKPFRKLGKRIQVSGEKTSARLYKVLSVKPEKIQKRTSFLKVTVNFHKLSAVQQNFQFLIDTFPAGLSIVAFPW